MGGMFTVLVTGCQLLDPTAGQSLVLVSGTLDRLLSRKLPDVRLIHCGRSKGADFPAATWARGKGLESRIVYDENKALDQADAVVAFTEKVWWWRESREAELVGRAKGLGKPASLVLVPVPALGLDALASKEAKGPGKRTIMAAFVVFPQRP
jgi:hypothetical protein